MDSSQKSGKEYLYCKHQYLYGLVVQHLSVDAFKTGVGLYKGPNLLIILFFSFLERERENEAATYIIPSSSWVCPMDSGRQAVAVAVAVNSCKKT